MEREHLIIIALILVALYMMNKDDTKDTVQGMAPAVGPLGRIRYNIPCPDGSMAPSNLDCPPFPAHIRTRREGFMAGNDPAQEGNQDYGNKTGTVNEGGHIRLSNTYFGGSQHIKNHIRSRNTNSMFNAMTTGSAVCEPGSDPRDCSN